MESIPVERMQVQRDEMDARPDFGTLQFFDKPIPIDCQSVQIQLNNIQVPRMLYSIVHKRHRKRIDIGKCLTKFICHSLPRLVEAAALLQLFDSKRGSNVSKVVLVARIENVVTP